MSAGQHSDFRNSIRFPLHLQVTLKTPTAEYHATTTDISAGGICFNIDSQIDSQIEIGSPIEFSIEMPIEVAGSTQPVQVLCSGRVVRCSREDSGQNVAVVIDEYHFKRV